MFRDNPIKTTKKKRLKNLQNFKEKLNAKHEITQKLELSVRL